MGKIGTDRLILRGYSTPVFDDTRPLQIGQAIILRLGKSSDSYIYLWTGFGPSLAQQFLTGYEREPELQRII